MDENKQRFNDLSSNFYKKRETFLVLNDNKHIAVIVSTYNKELNKAYIVDEKGIIIWDLVALLKERLIFHHFAFIDVYYIKESLYFFVVISNIDYRFQFNIYTGEIGNLIKSR